MKAQQYNEFANPNLQPNDFRSFLVDRAKLTEQDRPDADWNRPPLSSAAKQKAAIVSAIGRGFVPTDAALAEVKLSKKELLALDSNKADLAARRASVEKIQKAIDAPLLTDAESKGYKPLMSEAEANAYTSGSFAGRASNILWNPVSIV